MKIKKAVLPIGIIVLMYVLFLIGQFIVINNTNLYALEAGSVSEAVQQLDDMDLTKEGQFETKDFYGHYLGNTSFILTKDGHTYYDQGYYMVYKGNYKEVFCINPLKTAWSISNLDDLNEINNHDYANLSTSQQERVSKLIITTEGLYNSTKDEEYLVGGQLLIWETVGSTLDSYTSNLEDNMSTIETTMEQLDFSSYAKGGTTGENTFLYYDTSGQDLVGSTEDPVIDPEEPTIVPEEPVEPEKPVDPLEPDAIQAVQIEKTSDYEWQEIEDGQEVTYQLRILNRGTETEDVFVKDELSDPNLFVDDTQNLMINDKVSDFTIADLKEGFTLEGVASGDEVVITYTAIVQKTADYNDEAIVNTASACIEETCDEDMSTIDSVKQTNIQVQKTMKDDNGNLIAEPGEKLYFEINVLNDGETIENVLVKDELNDPNINYNMDGTVYINGEDKGNTIGELQDPGILVENVKPGEMIKVTFEAKVIEEPVSSSGTVGNKASVCVGDDCVDGTGELPTGGFSVEKQVVDASGDTIAQESEQLTYSIYVTNQGSEAADFKVTDVIDETLVNVDKTQLIEITPSKSTTPTNANINDLLTGLTIKGINPGETVVVTYTVNVKDDLMLLGDELKHNHIANSVEVCSSDDCEDDSAVITTDPEDKPIVDGDLAIQKQITDANGDGIAEPGEKLKFDIRITNGLSSEQIVTITDPLEDINLIYNQDEVLKVENGYSGEFTTPTNPVIGDLTSGVEIRVDGDSQFEFSYTAIVADPLNDTSANYLFNDISLCTDDGCTNGGGIITVDDSIDFDVEKSNYDLDGDNVIQGGNTIHYDIVVTNTGNKTSDVILNDTFPSNNVEMSVAQDLPLTITPSKTVESTSGNATVNDLIDGITIKDVAPGESVTISYELTVSDPLVELEGADHITNIATVCYSNDAKEECESSSSSMTINGDNVPSDDLGVIKNMFDTDGDGMASEGEELSFEIIVSNDSIYEQTITVTDQLADSNIAYNLDDELVIENGEFVGPSKVGNLPDGVKVLVPGNSSTKITYKAKVKSPLSDSTAVIVNNTVKVCNEDGNCGEGGDLLPIVTVPGYSVDKRAYINDVETTEAIDGDVVHYVITVKNTGNKDIEDLTVLDVADDGLLIDDSRVDIKYADGSTVSTVPATPTLENLFESGILISSLPRGEEITIEYDMTVSYNELSEENAHYSNIATVCQTVGDCKDDSATLTVDPTLPVVDGDLAVVKAITDSEDMDDIANPGEELTFTVKVSNSGEASRTITLQDNLDDVNMNYNLSNEITVSPASTTNPSSLTLQNIKDGDAQITIPPLSTVTLSFVSNVKTIDEGFVTVNQEILNRVFLCEGVTNCNEDEAITDGGGHIYLPDTVGFDIQKDVAINGDNTINEAIEGDALTYTIKLTNNRTTPISDVTIKDSMDDDIILSPVGQDLELTLSTGFPVETTPANPTTDDLYGDGIVVNSEINPGQSVSFTVEAQVNFGVNSEENKHLTNVVTACSSTTVKSQAVENGGELCAEDNATVTIDPSYPVAEEIGVVKKISDENEDGEAQLGEKLTFTVEINNAGTSTQIVTVKDELSDPNLDYGDLATTYVKITPDTIVTTPANPVLQDLKDGILQIEIPAGQIVTLTYNATVKSPLDQPTNNEIINGIEACTDDGCTDGGGHITLPDTVGFDLSKKVAINDDYNDTVVENSDKLTYQISIQNNRNTELENIVVKDTYDEDIVVSEQDLQVTSSLGTTHSLTPASTTTQLFSDEGITIDKLEIGETLTFEYDAVAYVDSSDTENKHLTNLARACSSNNTKSQSALTDDGLCASDSAIVTTDPTVPVPDGKVGVVKKLTDEDGDGIASPGETLTFNIVITNSEQQDEIVNIQDDLDDANIDYNSVIGNPLAILPSGITTTPASPTIGDLRTGIDVVVPANQTVIIDFSAEVFDPIKDSTNSYVSNLVNACFDGKCTDGGGHIPLPGGKSFELTKDVKELTDLDGVTDDNIVSGGEELEYTIKITNTNNMELTNVNLQDVYDDNLIVASQPLLITSSEDNPDKGNPRGYTTDQLFNNEVVLQSLKPGETITVVYDAEVLSDLSTIENDHITNFASAWVNATEKSSYILRDSATATVIKEGTSIGPDGIGIVKNMIEEVEDGVAEAGEAITFEVIVTNENDISKNVILTDDLDDVNIEYDLIQELDIEPAGTLTQNPNSTPTVGDLQTGDFVVRVPADSTVKISFTAKVKNPLVDTSVDYVSNGLLGCVDGECTDGGGHIALPDINLFTLNKTVETPSGTNIVESGDVLNYKLAIQNVGNTELSDIVIKDVIDDSLSVSEKPISIDSSTTQSPFDSTNLSPNPAYVVSDLMGDGITIDKLDRGSKVVLSYDATVKDNSELESEDIVNNAYACVQDISSKGISILDPATDDLCASDSVKVTTDLSGIDNDEINVNKVVEDENGNNIAEPNENITFNIYLENVSGYSSIYTITDLLSDSNLNYGAILRDPLVVEPSTTITTPSAPTVGDLQTGIEVTIPANSIVKLSYTVPVNPSIDENTQYLTNLVEACNSEGCTDGGGHIPVDVVKDVAIQKDFVLNSGNTDGIVSEGESFTYKISFTNTGNKLTDMKITDEFPTSFLNVDTTQTITVAPHETEPSSAIVADLLGDGITVKDVAPAETVTISYRVSVKDPLSFNGIEYEGDIDNIASVCTLQEDKSGKNEESCASDGATVTTDVTGPGDPDVSALKTIEDESADGIASPGEKLTFRIKVVNDTNNDANYMLTDPLSDPNVDYASVLANPVNLEAGNGTFVNPTSPTVGDLQSGIEVSIPAHDFIEVTFDAKVVDPLIEEFNYEVINNLNVCEIGSTDCKDIVGTIPLPTYQRMNINKEYTTVQTYDPDPSITGDEVDYVNGGGQEVNYKITAENIGNQDISNFIIKDKVEDNYYDYNTTDEITIKDSNGIEFLNGTSKFTIEDLANGITYDRVLEPGQSVIVTFTVHTTGKISELLTPGEYIANIAGVCYDNTFTSDTTDVTCKTNGTETPYTDDPSVTPPIVSDDSFTIDKWIEEANVNDTLEPGENLKMHIYVTNDADVINPLDPDAGSKTIKVTDDMSDPNINYASAIANEVKVTNLTTGDILTSGVDADGNTVVVPGNPKVSNLELSDGIELTIKDGETIELVFDVNANSEFQ